MIPVARYDISLILSRSSLRSSLSHLFVNHPFLHQIYITPSIPVDPIYFIAGFVLCMFVLLTLCASTSVAIRY